MSKVSVLTNEFAQKFLHAKQLGIIDTITEEEVINGKHVLINGRQLNFFGNCSYLGIEADERVKQRAIEALLRFGTVFSSSRTYVSIKYLHQVEEKLHQLFGHPVLISQTTGLAHIAWIPLVATKGDVIVMDHQVHRSVQNAVQMVKANGVEVELMRHNRMDLLEEKIIELSRKYNKVWYMADSIYSMYGDVAPLQQLEQLLNTYEQFYLYIDDAHGMSWAGNHGCGYVLSKIAYHPKMCLATSLVKGFGANGAALVFSNQQMKDIVRLSGSPFIFSGPPSPAALGAIDGSADIHLSNEIYDKQAALQYLLKHFITTCRQLDIPLIKDDLTPVFYIGIGGQNTLSAYIVRDLMQEGYFVNASSYPSVPLKNEGIRITISTHQTKENITGLLTTLAGLLRKHGISKEMIMPAFEKRKEKAGIFQGDTF
jgi:7-keto-8-aminopelargonate synthetase-like enzyme